MKSNTSVGTLLLALFFGTILTLGLTNFVLPQTKQAEAYTGLTPHLNIGDFVITDDGSEPQTEYVINPGESAIISWFNTDYYYGNMCFASGDWSGQKASSPYDPSTGEIAYHSETVGPMNTPGTYYYSLVCMGPYGISDEETVTLTVNEFGTIICNQSYITAAPGEEVSLSGRILGGDGQGLRNANAVASISPSTSNSPFAFNPITVPTSSLGFWNISGMGWINSNSNTTPGTYTITVNVDSRRYVFPTPCEITLVIEEPVYPPTATLECYDYNTGGYSDHCSIPYNSNAYLNWSAANVNNNGCNVTSDPYDWSSWYNNYYGSSGSGSNYGWGYPASDTVYTLTCNGPGGTTQDIATIDVGTDFAMSCDPAIEITPDLQLNSSAPVSVSNYTMNGHSETIMLSADISPSVGNGPTVYFDSNTNPASQSPDAYPPTLAYITTAQNTPPGDYSVTFTGSSAGLDRSCGAISFTVSSPPPEPPVSFEVNNNVQCGQLTMTWQAASGGTAPAGYRIYRRASNQPGAWNLRNLAITQNNGTFSAVETSPLEPQGYYTVVAYNASNVESDPDDNETLGVPIRCVPAISALSDLDVFSVSGRLSQNFNPEACSSNNDDVATLPQGAVFTPGDVVTFKLNICNSGPGPLVNISISNELSNLVFSDTDSVVSDCAEFDSYDADSLSFTIPTLAAKPANNIATICSITYEATIASPSAEGAAIHRYISEADVIGYDNYGTEYTANLFTPGYLFNAGGREPSRTEAGAQ